MKEKKMHTTLPVRIWTFLREKSGVLAIEVVLTISAYFMVIFMIFEMGRITITHAYLDLVVTEAARITKNLDLQGGSSERANELKQNIKTNYHRYVDHNMMGVFAHSPLDLTKLNVEVKYADKPDDLFDDKNTQVNNPKARLGRYSIEYQYSFSIPLPFSQYINPVFRRQFFVVVQKK